MNQFAVVQARVFFVDDVVLLAKQFDVFHVVELNQTVAQAIVDIVIVIGCFVGQVGTLCFQAGLLVVEETLRHFAKQSGVFHRAVFENAFAGFITQVQAGKLGVFLFQLVDHAQ